jgi:predicted nucleic acid-binding protein
LGYGARDADLQMNQFEALFSLISETADIYPAWKSLVAAAAVIGKQVHDARLAAVCQVTGISKLLTFNVRHFTRYASLIPKFKLIDPAQV